MLYWLAETLGFPSVLNLIRYLTFRSGAAVATAMLIGLLNGPWLIRMLRRRQGRGQPIRSDGPQTHLIKQGTPTMGGLMMLIAIAISLLLWMDLKSHLVWATVLVTLGFAAIGFMDDYDKVAKASHRGIPAKLRLLLEFAIAGGAAWIILRDGPHLLYLPFISNAGIDLGPFYFVFAAFTIVAFAAPGVPVPFVSGVIDCAGTSVRANVVNVPPDPEHVKLGMKLRLTTFPIGKDSEGVEAISFGFEPIP